MASLGLDNDATGLQLVSTRMRVLYRDQRVVQPMLPVSSGSPILAAWNTRPPPVAPVVHHPQACDHNIIERDVSGFFVSSAACSTSGF